MSAFFSLATGTGLLKAVDINPPLWDLMVNDLRNLESGWDGMGEGVVITEPVLKSVMELLFILRELGFADFRVQPGSSGEVLVIADRGASEVEIIIFPAMTYEFYLEKFGEELHESLDLSLSDLIIELNEQCPTYESSAPNTTMIQKEGLLDWLSGPHQSMVEYPSSKRNVLFQTVGQSVSTFRKTIAA